MGKVLNRREVFFVLSFKADSSETTLQNETLQRVKCLFCKDPRVTAMPRRREEAGGWLAGHPAQGAGRVVSAGLPAHCMGQQDPIWHRHTCGHGHAPIQGLHCHPFCMGGSAQRVLIPGRIPVRGSCTAKPAKPQKRGSPRILQARASSCPWHPDSHHLPWLRRAALCHGPFPGK